MIRQANVRQKLRVPYDLKQLQLAVARQDIAGVEKHLPPYFLNTHSRTIRVGFGGKFYIIPAEGTYEPIWSWDGAFGALIIQNLQRYYGGEVGQILTKASTDTLSLLAAAIIPSGPNQGLAPHMVWDPPPVGQPKSVDQRLWLTDHHSTITQPPVFVTAVEQVLNRKQLAGVYPQLQKHLHWLTERRDERGLVQVIHPWETGRDAEPVADSQYVAYGIANIREDQVQSLKWQTINSGAKDYRSKVLRFALLERLQALGPNATPKQQREVFSLATPEFNAITKMAWDSGARIARQLGDHGTAKQFEQAAQELTKAVNTHMWNEQTGLYHSLGKRPTAAQLQSSGMDPRLLQVDDQGRIATLSSSAFTLLAAEMVPDDRAVKMLDVLTSPQHFWTSYPVPTVSQADPSYHPAQYWRGSTWINTNMFVIRGLANYAQKFQRQGQTALANRFAEAALQISWKTLGLVSGDISEYYNSQTGAPEGPKNFEWSMLSIELIRLIPKLQALD